MICFNIRPIFHGWRKSFRWRFAERTIRQVKIGRTQKRRIVFSTIRKRRPIELFRRTVNKLNDVVSKLFKDAGMERRRYFIFIARESPPVSGG